MSTIGDLLPSSSGAWERAIAAAMSDDLPVPYAELLDPYQTPAEMLPFLAAHHSVDLWYEDWPEARKREMVAQYAGVSTIYPGESLAELKGTHAGALRFLAFVDAEVVDIITYPARFVIGRSALGVTPINHPPFKARYLVKVPLHRPVNAFIMGRSAIGKAALRKVDIEPIRRAKFALKVSKAEETEYVVSFAWRRPITLGDAIPADGSHTIGGYVERKRL